MLACFNGPSELFLPALCTVLASIVRYEAASIYSGESHSCKNDLTTVLLSSMLIIVLMSQVRGTGRERNTSSAQKQRCAQILSIEPVGGLCVCLACIPQWNMHIRAWLILVVAVSFSSASLLYSQRQSILASQTAQRSCRLRTSPSCSCSHMSALSACKAEDGCVEARP